MVVQHTNDVLSKNESDRRTGIRTARASLIGSITHPGGEFWPQVVPSREVQPRNFLNFLYSNFLPHRTARPTAKVLITKVGGVTGFLRFLWRR